MAKCVNHPDREAVANCKGCGKPLCKDCVHLGPDKSSYCPRCAPDEEIGPGPPPWDDPDEERIGPKPPPGDEDDPDDPEPDDPDDPGDDIPFGF